MKNRYLFVFLVRENGELLEKYHETKELLSKTIASNQGKQIAKNNGWRLFSVRPVI